jgi:hypothetical protein
MTTIIRTYTQIEIDCCNCGITFTMPDWFYERAQNDSAIMFYCPQGHSQHYAKSRVTKLQERLERAEARERHAKDQLEASERSKAAIKGQVTKLKKRAKAGVCPCCNRSFVQLQKHIAGQHPDFKVEE